MALKQTNSVEEAAAWLTEYEPTPNPPSPMEGGEGGDPVAGLMSKFWDFKRTYSEVVQRFILKKIIQILNSCLFLLMWLPKVILLSDPSR